MLDDEKEPTPLTDEQLDHLRRWDLALHLLQSHNDSRLEAGLISHNRVISACAAAGCWSKALDLLEFMQRAGMQVDVYTFGSVVSACSTGSMWREALSTLGEMQIAEILPSIVVWNSAVSACARAGQWQRAFRFLGDLQGMSLEADVVTYSSVIKACDISTQWQLALTLLGSLRRQDIRANLVTFNTAITACVSDYWDLAVHMLQELVAQAVCPDPFSLTTALDACGAAEDWPLALTCMEGKIQATTACWNAMIKSAAGADGWTMGVHLLQQMPADQLQPNIMTLGSALKAAERASEWDIALLLAASIPQRQLRGNVITDNSLLSALSQASKWQAVLHLLDAMAAQCQPDVVSYNTTITACTRATHSKHAMEILSSMEHRSLERSAISFNSAVGAFADGRWTSSLELLASMSMAAVVPNAGSCSAAMNACEKGGEWRWPLEALATARPGTANTVVYNAAMSACAQAMQWIRACGLMRQMTAATVAPSVVTFNSLVNALASGRKPEVVLQLLPAMAEAALLPNAVTLSSVVDACARGERWMWALTVLEWFPRHRLSAPLAALRSAARAASCAGRWRRAAFLLETSSAAADSAAIASAAAGSELFSCRFQGSESICELVEEWRYQPKAATAWLRKASGKKALEALEAMRSAGLVSNVFHSNAASGSCAHSSQWSLAIQLLHAAEWIQPDIVSYNTAIGACGPSGLWGPAAGLLLAARAQKLCTDVVSCTATLSAFEKGSLWKEALEVFRGLPDQGLEVTQVSLNSALSALTRPGHWLDALHLLSAASDSRSPLDVVSFATSSTSAPWLIARDLLTTAQRQRLRLESMPMHGPWRLAAACSFEGDAASRGMLVRASAAEGDWVASLAMHQVNRQDDLFTYNHILKSMQDWCAACFILHRMETAGIQPSAVTTSTLVNHVVATRGWRQTMLLLHHPRSHTKSIYAFNGAISAYSGGRWLLAICLVAQMSSSRLLADTISYNAATTAMEAAGSWAVAIGLLCQAADRNLEHTGNSFRAAITATTSRHRWRSAVALWRFAERVGVGGMRAASLQACQSAQQWQWALAAFSSLDAPSIMDCNCALGTCVESSSSRLALQVLRSLRLHELRADTVSVNSAMGACGGDGNWQMAAWLLRCMASSLLQHSAISFGTAIDSCGRFGVWHSALQLGACALRSALLDVVGCSSAIKACSRGQQWAHAIRQLSATPAWRVVPNEVVLSGAIDSCGQGLSWPSALLLLSQPAATKDSICHNAAMDALHASGRWLDGVKLLQQMRQKALKASFVTCNSMVAALAGGSWRRALSEASQANAHRRDVTTGSLLVAACERGHHAGPVAELFREVAAKTESILSMCKRDHGMLRVPSNKDGGTVSVSVAWPTFVTETRLTSNFDSGRKQKRRRSRSASSDLAVGLGDRGCRDGSCLPPWMRIKRFWCLFVIVVLIVAGSIYNVILTRLVWLDHQRNSVLELASLQAMVITNRIRTSIGALKTLEAMIQLQEIGVAESNFHQIAPALRRTYKGITTVALAKHGVISVVDPPHQEVSLLGFPLLQLLREDAEACILSGSAKASAAWDTNSSALVVLHPIFAPHAARILPNAEWIFNGQNYSRDCSSAYAAPESTVSEAEAQSSSLMDEAQLCSFPGVSHTSGSLAYFWGFAMLFADFEDAVDMDRLHDLYSGGWAAAGFRNFSWRATDMDKPSRTIESEHMPDLSHESIDMVGVDAEVPEIGLRWRFELSPIAGWQDRNGWWVNTLVAFPVTLVLSVGMGIFVIASLRRRTLDKLKLQRYRSDVLSKAVSASIEVLEKFQFPLCLVSVEDFLECGKYPSYEQLRDLGKHIWLDDCWDAEGTYEDAGILLVSYDGTDRHTDGFHEDADIYKAMVTSIRGLQRYGLKFKWVWSEYSCMPQQNSIQHQCAINSIVGYCSCFSAMLVVESRKGAEQHSFSSSFASWSLLERLCFVTCQCLEGEDTKVFRYAATGVLKKERIDRSAAEYAWDILRGSFHCCTKYHADGRPCDKQRFVGAILSAYWRLLALERAGGSEMASQLVQVLQESTGRYFPPTFTYWSEQQPVQLELFAGLIAVVHDMFEEDSAKPDADRAIVPHIAGLCSVDVGSGKPKGLLSPTAVAALSQESREVVLSTTF
eukprot:s56_g7.t2